VEVWREERVGIKGGTRGNEVRRRRRLLLEILQKGSEGEVIILRSIWAWSIRNTGRRHEALIVDARKLMCRWQVFLSQCICLKWWSPCAPLPDGPALAGKIRQLEVERWT